MHYLRKLLDEDEKGFDVSLHEPDSWRSNPD